MNKYRIVEHLLNNGTTKYEVQVSYSVFSFRWEPLTEHHTLEDAKQMYDNYIKWQEEHEGRRNKSTKVLFP